MEMNSKQRRIKTILASLMSVCLIMISFQTAKLCVQAEEIKGTGKITTDSLNVRSGPGKDYDAIGKVYSSETVQITGQDSGWYQIDYNGTEGFVSSKYVEMEEEISLIEEKETNEETPSETPIDEEELTPHGLELYKVPILIGIIVLVFIIILITLKGIRKLDDDDDEYEDDDDEYEDDDDEYEEDDDDEDDEEEDDDEDDDYEYERRRPIKHSSRPSPQRMPQRTPQKTQPRPVQRAPQPVRTQPSKGKELDMILSNNPDDYRIDIDPIYFEDEKKTVSPKPTDADLEAAVRKMEELQREIERIKNNN